MSIKAYLTIDDSPCTETDQLTDFLLEENIPAVLFCRGHLMEEHPDALVRAVQKGFIVSNHAYTHERFHTLSLEDCKNEILQTEALIDDVYQRAGVKRTEKYFRFPQMDRGAAGWVVDYSRLGKYREDIERLFADGLNIDLTPPTEEQIEKKVILQQFLKDEGFTVPYENITDPRYVETEMAEAIDHMYTFSTSDWMLLPRHKGKWPYQSLDDLKRKIDEDTWLRNKDSRQIILAHDKEGMFDIVKPLLLHMKQMGVEFLEFKS